MIPSSRTSRRATGYQSTRYRADSATVFIKDERVLLQGEALTERQGALLEADTIRYQRDSCLLDADGNPHLFDRGQVLVGEGIRYDTCKRRGIVDEALTNFTEGSTVWFLRGNVAQDSSSSRIYAGSSQITSCDLPTPHYHFSAREMKWISKNVLVARPVVLYVRDVPILWLPFIFQDVRPGRHSGILVPQFGINDLVRPTRQLQPSDHQPRLLLGAERLSGSDRAARLVRQPVRPVRRERPISMAEPVHERVDRRSTSSGRPKVDPGCNFRWDHSQQFNLTTRLNFNLNYASNTTVIQRNAIDPLAEHAADHQLAQLFEAASLGHADPGRQPAPESRPTAASSSCCLPSTLSPVPIALGSDISWSPGLSFTNNTTSNPRQGHGAAWRSRAGSSTRSRRTRPPASRP